MIVITNPTSITNEIEIIHSLFEVGLELLHIRKPDYSETEMNIFLSKIKEDFRPKLVLHSHHQLANDFNINRIHFTRKVRNEKTDFHSKHIKSTSTHSIEEFNGLSNDFDYAFLSPVFPSISKENYQSKTNLFSTIKNRTNTKTKLIALGGIKSDNIKTVLEYGFDDVALLGTIWNSTNAIENFKQCQQIVLSF